jgi:hypothetical protein
MNAVLSISCCELEKRKRVMDTFAGVIEFTYFLFFGTVAFSLSGVVLSASV